MQDADRWAEQARLVFGRLNEQQRRWVAGLLSKASGWGGDTEISQITGVDPKTIKRGRDELDSNLEDCPTDRIRRKGAGRPPLEKKILVIEDRLKALVSGHVGGDPTGKRKYVRCSLRSLAKRLKTLSHMTVGRLLRKLGYSLRANVKRLSGPPHPDRDRQFRYIQRQKRRFAKKGLPTISVDTKNTELIGNF